MTTDASTGTSTNHAGLKDREVVDWSDLGQEMWSYLTGRGAEVNYNFVDMTIEVPRDTGPAAPRATWKLNGALRITTSDQASDGPGERSAEGRVAG